MDKKLGAKKGCLWMAGGFVAGVLFAVVVIGLADTPPPTNEGAPGDAAEVELNQATTPEPEVEVPADVIDAE